MVDFENLSDDKLREALSDKGVEVGPITENTRNVYKRKLKRLSTEGVGGAQIKKEGVAIDQVSCDRTNGAGDGKSHESLIRHFFLHMVSFRQSYCRHFSHS